MKKSECESDTEMDTPSRAHRMANRKSPTVAVFSVAASLTTTLRPHSWLSWSTLALGSPMR